LDSSLVSVGDGMAGDAIGATEPLSTITTLSFPTVRRSMAGMGDIKDSTTLELRADMKGSATLVAIVGMKDPAAPELSAGRKDSAAETPVTTDFTVARPSAGLQSRTPKPARILVPLEGTTMGATRAATRIGVPRACTAGVLMGAVFTEVAPAAAVD
jgi:hypothetical protein